MNVVIVQILQIILSATVGKAKFHAARCQALKVITEITPMISTRNTPRDRCFDTCHNGIRMFLSMAAVLPGVPEYSVQWNICSTVSLSKLGASRRTRQHTSPGLCHQKKMIKADSVMKATVVISKREKGRCWARRPIHCRTNQASCTQVIVCVRISIFASYERRVSFEGLWRMGLMRCNMINDEARNFTLAMSDFLILSRTMRFRSTR